MIICPDDLLEPGPDRWNRELVSEAWAQCRRDLREALKDPEIRTVAAMVGIPGSGKSTWSEAHDEPGLLIFDACWTHPGRRRGLATQIARAGRTPVAVWIRTPLAVCQERNAERPPGRRVPPVAIARAWVALRTSPPSTREGWSRVVQQSGDPGGRTSPSVLPPSYSGTR